MKKKKYPKREIGKPKAIRKRKQAKTREGAVGKGGVPSAAPR